MRLAQMLSLALKLDTVPLVVISSGGSVQKAINLLADKAVRSMGMLFSTIRCWCSYLIHMLNLYWIIVVKSGVSPVQKNVKEFIENS